MFVDCLQLSGISFFNVVEHVREKFTEEVQEFEIVLFDGHFNVETNELTHVSVSEWIFGSKDGSDFKDSLEISHDAHLLVELRGLSKASFTIEIAECENIGSSFWTATDEFRTVDFNKIIVDNKFSEEMADSWRKLENSLLGSGSKIDDSVVETSLH